MGSFTPARLTLARERRGMNKSVLAERGSVTAQSIVHYESGHRVPTDAALAKIAEVLYLLE